ncbi:MAG: WD40 repeat domain-containing protein, partial [Pseudonocardiaceae bacterium]
PDDEHLATVSAGSVTIRSIKFSNSEPVIVRNPVNRELSGKRAESLSRNGLRYAFENANEQKINLLGLSSSPAFEVAIERNCDDVLRLSFDPSGDFLACVDKSEIIVWSTKSRDKTSRIPLPEGYAPSDLAVSPQGRYVAASSFNGEVRLWDTGSSDHTGTIIRIEDEKSIAFSPDGKWLSIGARDETMLWGLNVEKFDSRRIPVGGSSMKFSPDGSLLAVRAKENTGEISVWNVHDSTLKEIVSSSSSPRGTVGLSSPPDVS